MAKESLKVAIISRPGGCFPNIISQGLAAMLNDMGINNTIFYEGIPYLMRVLPLSEEPKHWYNSRHFRLWNRIKYFNRDRLLLGKLKMYDLIVISECLPNALWHNYLAIEHFRRLVPGKVFSYSDGPIQSAPKHKSIHLNEEDCNEARYDGNLFLTSRIEQDAQMDKSRQWVIGLNISYTGLRPIPRNDFFVILDFEQKGYESYREIQKKALEETGIRFIELNGRYTILEIRKLYSEAAIFFMSFPETFGMPLAECFSAGTAVFTPESFWPMAWRLDNTVKSWQAGKLAECFHVYNGIEELKQKLLEFRSSYHSIETPVSINRLYLDHYSHFYRGNKQILSDFISGI